MAIPYVISMTSLQCNDASTKCLNPSYHLSIEMLIHNFFVKLVYGIDSTTNHPLKTKQKTTAATPLDKSTTDRIRKSIESSKIAKEFKSLKIKNKVHTDLIGGLIVDFGDEKTVDLSVKSRVQKLDQLISREFFFLFFFFSRFFSSLYNSSFFFYFSSNAFPPSLLFGAFTLLRESEDNETTFY